jgi:hypothetical protein
MTTPEPVRNDLVAEPQLARVEPELKIRVQCPSCHDANRFARRHCKICDHTGWVYIRVPRNADGNVEFDMTAEGIMKNAVVIGSAPRPRPGEEQ